MIDLSHLTEEEQGVIMTVLVRDAELKRAEEERISKLEKILSSGAQLDTKRKYLTGEWFYEAKSRRHMDKIHGSEIILASMKQRRAGLDGSLRAERSKAPSSRGSDIVPPPKPARLLEAQAINDADKENMNSGVRHQGTLRHNPFNRASFIVFEPPENNNDMPMSQDQESSETEPIYPLKSQPAGGTSQTSGGSVTSEGSSVGFRPVPKKRTFVSRRTPSQSESNGLGLDTQVGSAWVVPAPRRSLQRGSSGSSNQSYLKGQDEMPPRSVASDEASQFAQPSRSLDENTQWPLRDVSQVSSNSSLERERNPPSLTKHRSVDDSPSESHQKFLIKLSQPSATTHNLHNFRPATYSRSDASNDREVPQRSAEHDNQTQREWAAINILHSSSIQESDRENKSSVGTSLRQEDLSLPQSTMDADPPVSYDLNFIDTSDQQMQKKSNQNRVFKLSTQTNSPTSDEDSIAKVLDWFSRSTEDLDWLNTEDSSEPTKGSDKHEISKVRGEDSSRKDAGDVVSNRKKETLETKRGHLQKQNNEARELRATDRQEEATKDTRERMKSQKYEDYNDESQTTQISHLKSFWEKSNMGPKILVSKSIKPGDKGQKPALLSVEKDEEKVERNKSHGVSDMPSVPGIYNGKGSYGEERQQELIISPQEDTGDIIHLNSNQGACSPVMNTSTRRNQQVADRRSLDTRPSPQSRTSVQSRLNLDSEGVSSVKPNLPSDSIYQCRDIPLQDELSGSISVSQLDTDLQARDSPDFSRNSPYLESLQVTSKTQMRKGSSEDVKRWDSEERSLQSSMYPKRKEEMSNKDRINSPHLNRKGSTHQESTAEKIKQLKLFWEQERNKPMFYTGKPKAVGDGKVARGANQAKLNKRFTKSEFDLTSIGNYSGSDEEDYDRTHPNFTVLPLNQRLEKSSPGLSTSQMQFNTLREFWDDTTSDTKGSFYFDKPKSPKRKEPQLSSQELKFGDPENYCEKSKPAVMKSSPTLQNQSRSPRDRQPGSRGSNDSKSNLSHYTTAEQQRESRRSSKDSSREEKFTKPLSSPGKETRTPKNRKDSFSNSSSRRNSMRRATSMFALSVPEDQNQLKMDVSPVRSQSRKQRLNAEKSGVTRRSSGETETPTPRARACVPRDYRHYLGMTDKSSIHTSLAPAPNHEGSEGRSGYEFDVGGPMRASTPVSSEERYSKRGSKMSQRPLWANYSSSDTGQESSISSMSDTWSRNSSNRDNVDDCQNPVRKALRRAEARPKNLAKSMEDITASLSPRLERRPEPTDDMRRITDVSPIPSTSLFTDPDHLKKMSKSVPSFLQNEDVGRDTDSNCEDSYDRGRLTKGNSLTNLTSSSGMASSLSGSVMTMYSADFGNVEVQGNIHFSINYIQKLREFHIFVSECRDLAAVDPKRGRSDPYVKSYLVPDKANLGKRKTSVKKKTLNPAFNEILRYRVRMEYLRTQTLILSVWHHDTFGRNSFLGEVDVDLSKWDFDHTQMNYSALKARTTPTLAPSNGRGEMRLALRFMPQIIHSEGLAKEGPNTGEIHIWVKECKNLPLIRATIDPYVKCFVLPDMSRKSRQKTRVLRRTVDPAFNHTMVYDGIREVDLAEACVELTVWDRDRLASNLLGGLRLGAGTGRSYGALVDWMDSSPYEVALWERMKATPNEWVEDVLPLRMLNSAKTAFK